MDDLTLKHMVEAERLGRHYSDAEGAPVIEIRIGRLATIITEARSQERERCAKLLLDGRFLHDEAPASRLAKEAAAAIRALQ